MGVARTCSQRVNMEFLLRVRGASQIVQVCKAGERVLVGSAMKEIAILKEEIIDSKNRTVGVIVNSNGRIESLGFVEFLSSNTTGYK